MNALFILIIGNLSNFFRFVIGGQDDEEEQQLVGNLCDEETNDVLLVAPEVCPVTFFFL